MRCPDCDGEGPLQRAAGSEVVVGSVAALCEPRPVVACPAGHAASPTEAVRAARRAVSAQIPVARRRRLRADACRSCAAPLTLPVRRSRRSVSVAEPGLPVHTLHLDLPLTRCPDCAIDQVPVRSSEDLTAATGAAYRP